MNSIEGSSMNYYVPLQDAETPPKKCISVLPARRVVRILNSRYALTATGYKYLDIGINVGPPSYVEIAIGDHRGNELILSLETWKELYEQRWNIQNHLCKDVRGRPLTVGPLTVRFSESPVCDTKLVCLDSSDVRLMMTESTFFSMLNLDSCIELTYAQLDCVVEQVDAKFVRFSNIASAETKDASNAIRVSACFNTNNTIDCELLALVFKDDIFHLRNLYGEDEWAEENWDEWDDIEIIDRKRKATEEDEEMVENVSKRLKIEEDDKDDDDIEIIYDKKRVRFEEDDDDDVVFLFERKRVRMEEEDEDEEEEEEAEESEEDEEESEEDGEEESEESEEEETEDESEEDISEGKEE
ncbi:aspartic and glutamic acid-rich protein-like [Ooceraea biroi]|uniref:aspartic and glutamic acid-rich protein-like n=1 Tax=Ooceraea biroi TaxID=2015173 RepID=UPI000F077AF2|nr:aspartic and glutamic acid-rich protein-like [Ooceraea biroi]